MLFYIFYIVACIAAILPLYYCIVEADLPLHCWNCFVVILPLCCYIVAINFLKTFILSTRVKYTDFIIQFIY